MITDYLTKAKSLNPSILLALDAANRVTDLSGNGRNGTGAGSITVGGYSPGPLVVDDGGATDFNGSGNRITTTYSPFVNGSTLTFTGWAYRDTSSSSDSIFSSDASFAGNLWPVFQLPSGSQNVTFRPRQTAGLVATWAAAWPGNAQWVHWALVQNQPTGELSLYINGALVSTQTVTGQYDATPGNLLLGRSSTSEVAPFDGKMQGFAIYEYGLPADEIAGLYDAGTLGMGITVPGFVTDAEGNLAVTTDATDASYEEVPGFFADPNGKLVVTTTTTDAERQNGFLKLNDALVVAEEAGDYGVVPGFTATADAALCVVNEGTVDWVDGFLRDADGSLGVTGL